MHREQPRESDTMEQMQLDWSTAEVNDGTLTIALDGKPPKEWIARFNRTVHLLNQRSWEKVKLKKDAISVKTITAGDEDRLRHFLESVVLEANTVLAPDDSDNDADDDAEDNDDAASTQDGPDVELTERFRAFAPSDSDSSRDRKS
jgi:hypothetical protein